MMGKLIHVHSIPPLVSALFLFSLGIVALLSRKKEELWRTLAVFSVFLGAASAIAFGVTLIDDPTIANRTVRFAPFFGILALSFANYYAYVLTGRGDRIRLFGRRHVSGRLFAIVISVWALVLAILVMTGQLIANVEGFGTERPRVSFGPLMYVVIVLYIMGTIRNTTYFVTAYRGAKDDSFRQFIVLNVVAFHLVFGSVILFQFILPVWGFPTQLYAFIAFPIAVLIFYVAIVRYQFARVDDLNLSLERKVEERTAQLKRAQAKLVQSEKMASMGQLVAGIAHEVNNPIGAVKSMAQSNKIAVERLKTSVSDVGTSDRKKVRKILAVMDNANQVIEDGTKRVADVVETLRSFANLDEAEVQWFDVHEGLEDTLVILQHQIKPSVKINKQYTDVPRVNCFPAQLNQVFLNILTNANEAIQKDGEVTISTSCDDGNVCVTIEDTGVGIPEENRKKIFDPGFTTKGVGVGTGLGLAICYQIIKDHDGDIKVETQIGRGSIFTVVLPTSPRKTVANR